MKGSLATGAALLSLQPWMTNAAPSKLQKRDDNVSSCGDAWMPIDDITTASGHQHGGYKSAVDRFCKEADGEEVPAGGYLSLATEVWLNGGKDPSKNGIQGYVYFEVHNKKDSESEKITADNCKKYLEEMTIAGTKCAGDDNPDTKGGTFQVGDDQVSYHALGESIPPQQDAKNKIYTGVIETMDVNKKGKSLDPWPTDFTKNISPLNCHAHNDYEQDVPLFSALSAGCISIEADVWADGDDAKIGHNGPGDATLATQYVEPLKEMLDANKEGIFGGDRSASLTILIDFKTDEGTFEAVSKSLQPLRDGGYLSHGEGDKFVQGPVTIVLSGNAKLEDINNHEPRDMFLDARTDDLQEGQNAGNTYYASQDFKKVIGSSDSLSEEQAKKLKDQLDAAHEKGFKVRYWNLPGSNIWQSLIDAGLDRLNVDDLSAVAGIKF